MNTLRASARTPGKAALLLGKLAIIKVSSNDTRRRILAPPRQRRRNSPTIAHMGAKAPGSTAAEPGGWPESTRRRAEFHGHPTLQCSDRLRTAQEVLDQVIG